MGTIRKRARPRRRPHRLKDMDGPVGATPGVQWPQTPVSFMRDPPKRAQPRAETAGAVLYDFAAPHSREHVRRRPKPRAVLYGQVLWWAIL